MMPMFPGTRFFFEGLALWKVPEFPQFGPHEESLDCHHSSAVNATSFSDEFVEKYHRRPRNERPETCPPTPAMGCKGSVRRSPTHVIHCNGRKFLHTKSITADVPSIGKRSHAVTAPADGSGSI